ncbi:MAG: hypothetical protein ACHQT6_11890 [Candidatus Acidiferrales bacterium]
MTPKKLWGRSSRPLGRCLLLVLSASCCFSSLLSFWLPWIYSPFPFFMEFRNGFLLQLFECIESTQNEVKRKMIETGACNDVPKSRARLTREENVRAASQLTLTCSPSTLFLPRARFQGMLPCGSGLIAPREYSRSFPRSIMRGDFTARNASSSASKERNYGRFE